jgi:hypothetical protein
MIFVSFLLLPSKTVFLFGFLGLFLFLFSLFLSFYFWVLLEFELMVLHLLDRLYHASHAPKPFLASVIFQIRSFAFVWGQPWTKILLPPPPEWLALQVGIAVPSPDYLLR